MDSPFARKLGDHAFEVLAAAINMIDADGQAALAIVTDTQGGSVRRPGAMMAIGVDGAVFGYLSGGCIDSDIALRAAEALRTGEPMNLRYGEGSPFIDIRLPCGGRIDLTILTLTDPSVLNTAYNTLYNRKPVGLRINDTGLEIASVDDPSPLAFHYRPKIQLRVAGIGEKSCRLDLSRDGHGTGLYDLVT